jgi:formate hydrogenlyase subunit 4
VCIWRMCNLCAADSVHAISSLLYLFYFPPCAFVLLTQFHAIFVLVALMPMCLVFAVSSLDYSNNFPGSSVKCFHAEL